MGKYDRQIATAKRLIAAKGRACTWRELGNDAAPDLNKPWKPGAANNDPSPVSVVFLPDTRSMLTYLQTLTDTAINVGNDYGLMAAVDFTPTINAEIYDEANAVFLRKVKSIDPFAPDGDVILYTVRFEVAA